jgi:hypothetical protein
VTAAPVLQRPHQHDAADLLADANDLHLRLIDGRFAACPAEVPSSLSEPYPAFIPDPLEVARCL